MNRPRALDLFCCQGGASHGYALAGFDVTGVDSDPQPRYPYRFAKADALAYVAEHGHEYDLIAASPPCQRRTKAQKIRGREHPALIGPTRDVLIATGLPYVIENVPAERGQDNDDPLIDPILLCGSMFGLRTYRHRLFESNMPLATKLHPRHLLGSVKMGRPVRRGERYQAVGNFAGVDLIRADMGVAWMTREGIRECVPPPFTRFIGEQLMAHLRAVTP